MDWNGLVSSLDALTSSMPSQIRGDWKTYVDAVKQFADVMKGLDMSKMATDPTMMTKLEAASASLNDQKYQTAIDNINKYFADRCPGM